MKLLLITLLAVATIATAKNVDSSFPDAYGYLERFGIPEGERIRKAEEEYLKDPSRIINGAPATEGQIPYQAGLISDIIGTTGRGVCGGSLVTPSRVITAAHCWFDGLNQGWRFTVVLGSVLLFSGGTRIETSAVVTHPNWFPLLVRNDVAVIYLPTPVTLSATISVISLPSGEDLSSAFAGETAVAAGFGITYDDGGISLDQSMNFVSLRVITNDVCRFAFPLYIQDSHICTSGIGGSTCRGDSGGALAVTRDEGPVIIGITSFGSGLGCEAGMPAAFARVTSFVDFFREHM